MNTLNSHHASTIATKYLTAFYGGDFDTARALVADDLSFKGPFVEAHDKASFFASAAPLGRVVRGHRLLRQWADGDEVCSIFDLDLETPVGAGSVVMTEWHRVQGDRIVFTRVVFDTAAFRALIPPR